MILIVQYYDEFLQRKTMKIDFPEDDTSDALIQLIQQRVGRMGHELKIKCKRDQFNILIVPGWPIEFYELHDHQRITVEMRENDADSQIKESKRQHFKYLGKLGIQQGQQQKLSAVSETSENSDDEQQGKRSAIEIKQTEIEDQIFQIVKDGNLDQLKYICSSHKELLNSATFGGWNPIHFAAFLDHKNIVQYLLDENVDVNKVTDDGWTPLQIGIHKQNVDLVKMFLNHPSVDVNQITEKGLALNLACKGNQLQIIQMLYDKRADPNLQDRSERNAYDYCTQETLAYIEKLKKHSQFNQDLKVIDQFIPPKPPITKGIIYKQGEMIITLNPRFFVVNSDEGTFIRYKTINDYPLKPLEIIPLKSVKSVSMIKRRTFIQKPGFFYFELFYSSRMVLACKFENVAKRWVEIIYKAAVYTQFLDDKINAGEYQNNDSNNETQEVTILDEEQYVQVQQQEQSKKKLSPEPSLTMPQNEQIIMQQRLSEPNPPNQKMNFSTIETSLESLTENQDVKISFDSFEIQKELGSGAFGKVFLVKKKDDSNVYAMKALKKRTLIVKKQIKYAVTEANVLKQCRHPFILGLHYAFQTPNYLYLVLDYCNGGDLSYHLAQEGIFPEEAARFYMAELVLAIEFLHSKDVVYRDMKPENILIDRKGHIKLADFGLSKEGIGDQDKTKSFCGSPAYLSPDMLSQKGAGKPSDIYGMGAVLFEMIAGESPYYNEDIPTMYKNIQSGQLKWPKKISLEAKNLIQRMLERDPQKRITIKAIKEDPFFRVTDWEKVERCEYQPPITDFSHMQEDDDYGDDDDIGYKGKAIFEDRDYDDHNRKVNRVKDFSFVH